MRREAAEDDELIKSYFNDDICDEVIKLFRRSRRNHTCDKRELIRIKNYALII